MKWFASLVFLVMVVGCATPGLPSGYNVIISTDFTQEEVTDIQAGMQLWSVFPKGPGFSFELRDPSNIPKDTDVAWNEITIQRQDLIDLREESQDPSSIAYTRVFGKLEAEEDGDWDPIPNLIGGSITLPPRDQVNITDAHYLESIAHETGHAMGLGHTQAGTIMCAKISCGNPVPTCYDYQHYCNLRMLSCPCQ